MIRTVKMDDLSHDPKLQMRTKQDEDAIWEYAENLDKLPPMKVVLDEDGKYWPYDGWHTYEARRRKKCSEVQCLVTEGTYRDAVLLAAGANHCHGLRRTNDDKTKAVKTILDDGEWKGRSNNWIAEQCHVSDNLVKRVRESMEPKNNGTGGSAKSQGDAEQEDNSTSTNGSRNSSEQGNTRTGKDGKRRKAAKPSSNGDGTFVMCARCSRAGKPSCDSCREKKDSGLKPVVKGSKPKPKDDGLPKSVSNALADTWHAECARLISKMAKECKAAFSWSSWLDASVLDYLSSAEQCFLTAIPTKICPDCKGQKTVNKQSCLTCRGGGYMGSQS